jgi:hypothetical protein
MGFDLVAQQAQSNCCVLFYEKADNGNKECGVSKRAAKRSDFSICMRLCTIFSTSLDT